MEYATAQDFIDIYGVTLETAEIERVTTLITLASALLRKEAKRRGSDLDEMVTNDSDTAETAKIVICAAVQRVVKKDFGSAMGGDVSQFTQSAMGYSLSGTYLNPGDDLYFLSNELKRLGLKRQKLRWINLYGDTAEDDQ